MELWRRVEPHRARQHGAAVEERQQQRAAWLQVCACSGRRGLHLRQPSSMCCLPLSSSRRSNASRCGKVSGERAIDVGSSSSSVGLCSLYVASPQTASRARSAVQPSFHSPAALWPQSVGGKPQMEAGGMGKLCSMQQAGSPFARRAHTLRAPPERLQASDSLNAA